MKTMLKPCYNFPALHTGIVHGQRAKATYDRVCWMVGRVGIEKGWGKTNNIDSYVIGIAICIDGEGGWKESFP